MKHIFSRLILLFFAITGAASFSSCDKFDDNGPFYGYWLITDVNGPDGPLGTASKQELTTVVNTNLININTEKAITWAVRNELIMMHEFGTPGYYFFTFRRDVSTLQLLEAWHNDGSNDTPTPLADVPEQFYVPADGHYTIVRLDGKGMELRASDFTLSFKKN